MMLIEQDKLIQQHGAERQELAAAQAFDGHLSAPFKEVLEQAVEWFDRVGAQLVKDTPDFNAAIGVRISPPVRGDQFAVMAATLGVQLWGIVMLIAQDIADLSRQLGEQQRGDITVSDIGHGKLRGQRNPQTANRHRQVQLPAVPPAVPARLAPMGFGINGGVRDDARLPIFLMPDATVRPNHRAITSRSMTLLGPRIEEYHQVASKPPNQAGQ